MTGGSNEAAVDALIQDALSAGTPTRLLDEAARLTGKNGGWKGERRKLNRAEAVAATRVVTEQIHRLDLKPTAVLQHDGRASGREQTYRFFLTTTEMETGDVGGRPLAMGIGAHVENVRLVAKAARAKGATVDEEAMLAELASSVEGFLEQFRDLGDRDPFAELAEDVGRIATWLESPRRRFEAVRYLAGAGRLDLDYDTVAGEVSHVGRHVSDFAYGITPRVPLRTRPVATGECVVYRRAKAEMAQESAARAEGRFCFFAQPELREIGVGSALVCQKVGLGVGLDGGKRLRMQFTVDHVVYVGATMTEGAGDGLDLPRLLELGGIPEPGRARMSKDPSLYVKVLPPVQPRCADFRAYAVAALGEDDGLGPDEAVFGRRIVPVTAESCRLFLDGGERDEFFGWKHGYDIAEETVLPTSATDDEGAETWLVRERFAEVLYASGGNLAGMLEAETEKRVEAYEAHLLRSATGARKRKLEFRVRMRT